MPRLEKRQWRGSKAEKNSFPILSLDSDVAVCSDVKLL